MSVTGAVIQGLTKFGYITYIVQKFIEQQLNMKGISVYSKIVLFAASAVAVLLFLIVDSTVYSYFATYSLFKCLSWSPDGTQLAYEDKFHNAGMGGMVERTITVVDIATGKCKDLTRRVRSFAIPSGRKFLVVNNSVLFPLNQQKPFGLGKPWEIPTKFWGPVNETALSPDGKHLAGMRYELGNNQCELFVVDLASPLKKRVLVAHDESGISIRHDNNHHLVWDNRGENVFFRTDVSEKNTLRYWSVSFDGTGRKKIAEVKDNTRVYLSTEECLLLHREAELWIQKPETNAKQRLVSHDTHPITSVVFSPDKSRIAYTVDTPAGLDIYVINIDGTEKRKLGVSVTSPYWSPDSKKLCFFTGWGGGSLVARSTDSSKVDLQIEDVSGSDDSTVIPLFSLDDIENIHPKVGMCNTLVWSPDSGKILCSLYTDSNLDYSIDWNDRHDIWLVKVQDKRIERLTFTGGIAPQWFDDTTFLYINGFSGSLMSYNILRRKTETLLIGNAGEPDWSPDATKMVISSRIYLNHKSMHNDEGTSYLWLMDIPYGGVRKVTAGEGYRPCFSDTGRQIAFRRDDNFLVVNVDGSGLQFLKAEERKRFPGLTRDGTSVVSPDGTDRAFIKNDHDHYPPLSSIWLEEGGGKQPRLLVR